MNTTTKLLLLSSFFLSLTGCIQRNITIDHPNVYSSPSGNTVPRPFPTISTQPIHPFTGSITKDQMLVAAENVIQTLDDNYQLSQVTINKLQALFGVDLADDRAQHSNDRRMWQALSNDGLYFVVVNYADKPEGLKLVLLDWKNLQAEDHRLASIQHIPASTAHCLTLSDLTGFLTSHGWYIIPSVPQSSWPTYTHSNDPDAVQIQFGGSVYNPNDFGPCINQVALKKAPHKVS
jgi:hypothetical protein